MTAYPSPFEMRCEEADAYVAAVRAAPSSAVRRKLADAFLSDPALPAEQRAQIQQLVRRDALDALRPASSSAPPPV